MKSGTDAPASVFRSAAVVSFFTALSRVAGLGRDMSIAWLLGTSHQADALNIAYRIPNLLRRLTAEGAASAAFIPVFTAELTQSGKKAAMRIANSCFYLLLLIMTLVTVLGIFFSPLLVRIYASGFSEYPGKVELAAQLTRIMMPYMLLVSIAALGMGVLNSLHIFGPSAASPILLNLAMIGMATLAARQFAEPAVAVAIGVVLGGLLQLLVQIPFMKKAGMDFRWSLDLHQPAIRRMGQLMLPGLFGIGITQINVFIDSEFASWLGEGAVAALNTSDRVMEFILGVYTISIATAILPTFSRIAAEKNWPAFSNTFYFGMRMMGFLTIPASAGLILLRFPIISVLFQRGKFNAASTALTAAPLICFSIGLMGFSALKIVIPAFYARHDTRTPVRSATLALITNLAANFLFMRVLGVGGPALATTLAAYVNFFTLYAIIRRDLVAQHELELGRSLLHAAVATVPMAVFLWWVKGWEVWQLPAYTPRLAGLGGVIAAAAAIYFLGARLLRSTELGEFSALLGGRRKA